MIPRRPPLAGLIVLLLIFALQLWVFFVTLPTRRDVGVATAVAAPQALVEKPARFGEHSASPEAQQVANQVLATHDAQGRSFMLIDKKAATLYVFDGSGAAIGISPVLIGQTRGDDSAPGIGLRPVAQVRPSERTTPAGRFVTAPGRNAEGEPVVWIDYDAAVSMHRVRAHVAAERRLQRLASATAADNRISFGCINVPASFYDSVVWPVFSQARGVAYVLPDSKPLHEVFSGLLDPPQAAPPRSARLDLGP